MTELDRSELREVSAAVLAVTAHLTVREVLQTIVTSARRLLGADYAALGVPDQAGSFAEFVVDGVSEEQWAAIGPLPRQHGLLGVLLSDPHPVRLGNIQEHPRFEGWPAAHPALTGFIGMPITDGGDILGGLYLANKPGGFTAADEELLRLLAAHAAIALVNARLYERGRELSIMEERNRIARELHDAISQKLFSLRLTAEAAATLLERDPARAASALGTVRQLAAEATGELHAIVSGLLPPELTGDGMDLALRKHVELLDRVHGAAFTFASTPLPRLRPAQQEAVYRIAQEALHNAVRHAHASTVDVRLTGLGALVVLRVADDGAGFDPGEAGQASRRLGLASMRERARSAGGRLTIDSGPGGTTVKLEVPADA
ncbi:GAF domain-containing sensor histidine kinase [Longispora albida]|uniref:GAF domain-containing sensor histidine kinase n=1 Tax=Longispora albida TaxID=203523 RepID=UPI0003798123|nr:GAF domain-containing sensor histidine kinase [Longispora albida]